LPTVPFWASACGAVLFAIGFWMMHAALFENSFAAPIVGDQSGRGQTLIDTGMYSRVRHPMYTGLLLFMVGIALWLQSYASVP
jgi:protein-S-isoprenylcysteine O-methyltransferase Ste14